MCDFKVASTWIAPTGKADEEEEEGLLATKEGRCAEAASAGRSRTSACKSEQARALSSLPLLGVPPPCQIDCEVEMERLEAEALKEEQRLHEERAKQAQKKLEEPKKKRASMNSTKMSSQRKRRPTSEVLTLTKSHPKGKRPAVRSRTTTTTEASYCWRH